MFVPSSTLPPIVLNASAAKYHEQTAKKGDPAFVMSRSELLKFAACPNKWLRSKPVKKTAEMDYGSILDVLLLTPDAFDSTFAIFPKEYPHETKKGVEKKPWHNGADFCKAWVKDREAEGKRCVWQADIDEAKQAVSQIYSDPWLGEYIGTADRQVAVNVEWQDTETGIVVPCKALLDIVPKCKELADLKSTTDAERRAWKKKVHSERYDYQGAFYGLAYSAASGEKRTVFRNIISESGEPYECTHRAIHPDWLLAAKNDVAADMALYCRCLLGGEWAGYDHEDAFPDPWMFKTE